MSKRTPQTILKSWPKCNSFMNIWSRIMWFLGYLVYLRFADCLLCSSLFFVCVLTFFRFNQHSYGVIFLFCTLCVACGLYYLAELVEEYTGLAKRGFERKKKKPKKAQDFCHKLFFYLFIFGSAAIFGGQLSCWVHFCSLFFCVFFFSPVLRDLILFVLVLHGLLAVLEDFPLVLIVLGIVSHATYFTLLKRFPTISVTDVKFIASCILAVSSHILWFRHFTAAEIYYPFSEILAFFLFCVWIVPFGFFVSLSASDATLPHVGSSENLAGKNVFH